MNHRLIARRAGLLLAASTLAGAGTEVVHPDPVTAAPVVKLAAAAVAPTSLTDLVVPAVIGPGSTQGGSAGVPGCHGRAYRYTATHHRDVTMWSGGSGEVKLSQREVGMVKYWLCRKAGLRDKVKTKSVESCWTWINGPGPNSLFYYGTVTHFAIWTEDGGHQTVPNFKVHAKKHSAHSHCTTRDIPAEDERWEFLKTRGGKHQNIHYRMAGHVDWAPVVGGDQPFTIGNHAIKPKDDVYHGRV